MSAMGRFARTVAERTTLVGSSQSLFAFKEKFDPSWESRYLVASSTFGLPRIARAILQLRNSVDDGEG